MLLTRAGACRTPPTRPVPGGPPAQGYIHPAPCSSARGAAAAAPRLLSSMRPRRAPPEDQPPTFSSRPAPRLASPGRSHCKALPLCRPAQLPTNCRLAGAIPLQPCAPRFARSTGLLHPAPPQGGPDRSPPRTRTLHLLQPQFPPWFSRAPSRRTRGAPTPHTLIRTGY